MRPTILLLFLTLGLAACASTSRSPSTPDGAAFVTLLGRDTVAVESFRHTPTGIQADAVVRTPSTTVHHYTLDLNEAGGFSRYEAIIRSPGQSAGAPPVRREVVVPVGDSLQVTVTEGSETQTRTLSGDAQVLPFIEMIHWPFELMLMRAQSASGDSLTQQLFTDRNIMPFVVEKRGDDHLSVRHPFRGSMDVLVDSEGRLQRLDAASTTRKLTVTRVPNVNLESIAQSFAARDAAGQAFGPLSGRGETTAMVNEATITVDYGQPSKRGREIFGNLVPWDQIWRTGANQATHFETNRPLSLGGLDVPAGRYTLYTIPEPDGGTLIINRQTGQGGTTYNPDLDLGRVDMRITKLPETVEQFTIDVVETSSGGELQLKWDQTAFVVPFTVKD